MSAFINYEQERQNAAQNLAGLEAKYGDLLKSYTDRNAIKVPEHLKEGKAPASLRDAYIQSMQLEEDCLYYLDAMERRNVCTVSEYKEKWVFLHKFFETSGMKTREEYEKKRAEISEKYAQRFSITMPVIIVDDYDQSKVLCEIDPVVGSLNAITGHQGQSLVADFAAAMSLPGTEMRPDIEAEATSGLLYAMGTSNNQLIKQRQAEYDQYVARAVKVLEVFTPDHPLIAQYYQDQALRAAQADKQQTLPSTPVTKVAAKGDLDLSDDQLF